MTTLYYSMVVTEQTKCRAKKKYIKEFFGYELYGDYCSLEYPSCRSVL